MNQMKVFLKWKFTWYCRNAKLEREQNIEFLVFFLRSRIYKGRVQQGWGGVKGRIVSGGRDGAEEEGKACVLLLYFPLTPHPPSAARCPFPILPPKPLTLWPLANSDFMGQSSSWFLLLPRILSTAICKGVGTGEEHQMWPGMGVRPSELK